MFHDYPKPGGDAAFYVDPSSVDEIATAMKKIYSDQDLRNLSIEKGIVHAQNFNLQKCSEGIMYVYNKIL